MGAQVYAEVRGTAAANGEAVGLVSVPWPQRWKVTRMSTQGNSVLSPELRVYRGLTGTIIGTSGFANSDTSSEDTLTLGPGETVRVQWNGCTPGSVMRFTVEGERLDK